MAEEITKEDLTEEDMQKVNELLGYGSSTPEGKHTVHSFLYNVATAKDTTKLGNLLDAELGKTDHTVRAYKFLASFAKDLMNKKGLGDFFLLQSENATATSLSRGGFLTKLAVVQRKELSDMTPKEKKENKGWFKGKDKSEEKEG